MTRYVEPQELFIKFRDTDLIGNELNFSLHSDLYAQKVLLVEYELGGVNVSGMAGVPADNYLYLDVGDLRGGDETLQTTLTASSNRRIPLSTNNVLSTGTQRLQTPVQVSIAARHFGRAFTFRLFNEAGAPYVHAGGAGTFFLCTAIFSLVSSVRQVHEQWRSNDSVCQRLLLVCS